MASSNKATGFTQLFGNERGITKSHQRQAETRALKMTSQIESASLEEALEIYNQALAEMDFMLSEGERIRSSFSKAIVADAIGISWATQKQLEPEGTHWRMGAMYLAKVAGVLVYESEARFLIGYPQGFRTDELIEKAKKDMPHIKMTRLQTRLFANDIMIEYLCQVIVKAQMSSPNWILRSVTDSPEGFYDSEEVKEMGGPMRLARQLSEKELTLALHSIAFSPASNEDALYRNKLWNEMHIQRGMMPNLTKIRQIYLAALERVIRQSIIR